MSINPNAEEFSTYFDSRPSRDVTCSCCRGSGSASKPYALTYDADAGDKSPGTIPAAPMASSSIFECCREAAEIAGRARRPVVFWFNDQLVEVRVGDDPDKIARLWWFEAYGETPEDSASRR